MQPMSILLLASRSFTLDDRLLVKGWHSTYVEPLRCVLFNSFYISWEINSTYEVQFTAFDDGSVGFSMLSVQAQIYFDNEAYIVKQAIPDSSEGLETVQITASHIYNDVSRIYQHNTKTGTLTYTVSDVLDYFLKDNKYNFTYDVQGTFDKQQITDLGNGSGKDCLSKIVDTWPTAVIYPKGHNITVYSSDAFAVNNGKRIDYLHNTREIQITYDSNNIVNTVKAFGATKDDTGTDSTDTDPQYYFEPFMVVDQDSVDKWGECPGADITDDRFKDAASMKTYATSQLTPEPALTLDITMNTNTRPMPGEVYRTENRKTGMVINAQLVAYTWYPLDGTQNTTITLNNTSKTILDYQNSLKRQYNKAIAAINFASTTNNYGFDFIDGGESNYQYTGNNEQNA